MVVTNELALLWTDGRYFLQASKELDNNWTLMKSGMLDVPTKEEWLSKNLSEGTKVGIDPKLFSICGLSLARCRSLTFLTQRSFSRRQSASRCLFFFWQEPGARLPGG